MLKAKFVFCCFAGLLLLTGSLKAEEKLLVQSKISGVTVYSDRALVTRQAIVEIKTGVSVISFDKIPLNIDRNSLRVSGADKRLKILGLDILERMNELAFNPKLAELDEKIQEAVDAGKILEDSKNTLIEKMKYLELLKSNSKTKDGENRMSVKEIKELLTYVEETLTETAGKQRALVLETRKLEKKLELLKNERNSIAQGNQNTFKNAEVSVEAPAAGKYGIELSYVIFGAGWRPVYDVRAGASNSVEFSYSGMVTQNTGEDWNDIELALSTAKPYLAGTAPQLRPWYLNYFSFKNKSDVSGLNAQRLRSNSPLRFGEKKLEEEDQQYDKEQISGNLAIASAVLETGRTSVFFKIKKKMSIPSDSNPHKVPVALEKFEAKMEYEATPELSNYAYFKAKIKNKETPILSGELNIFLEDNYVGNSLIKEIAPGKEFEAYLGVDDSISIERKREENKESSSGWFLTGSNKKLSRQFRVIVQNFKKETVKLLLSERIPVSQNEEIKVALGKVMPEPAENTKEGFLKWNLELKPGEKKEITYEYTVEYPKDKTLPLIGE